MYGIVAEISVNKFVDGAHRNESKSDTVEVIVNALMALLQTVCDGVIFNAGGVVIVATMAVRLLTHAAPTTRL